MFSLADKVGLVVGIANEQSIAWGCAMAFRDAGAQLAVTYTNAYAEGRVRPLAERLGAAIVRPLEVTDDADMDAIFAAIDERWGRLDFLLHCVFYCPKNDLHARAIDSSLARFQVAMDVSCHSFLRMLRRAATRSRPRATGSASRSTRTATPTTRWSSRRRPRRCGSSAFRPTRRR